MAKGQVAMADPSEYQWHRRWGTVLFVLCCCFLTTGLISFAASAYAWTVILTIVAMIFGNSAFSHFEKAVPFKPSAPIIHDVDLFSSEWKVGGDVDVHLEIHYPSDQDSPFTLDRIKHQLQRSLNIYLSRIEALSPDPYAEIDGLLQKEIEPLRQELGLRKIALQTIRVKTVGASAPPTKGVYLRPR